MCRAALTTAVLLVLVCTALAAPTGTYFTENFDDSAGERYFFDGTLDGRKFRYVDGQYEIDTTQAEAYGQSVLLEDLDTYRVEVTARLLETANADGGGFGLSLNYQEREEEGSDFLLFLIYDRGAYAVLCYLDSSTSVLYSPTKTKLFKPGEMVNLMVDANQGQLTFYINGAEVAQLREERLVSGGFGVFATAMSVARFDDFTVYADKPVEPLTEEDDFAGEKALFEGTWGDVTYTYEQERYVIDTSATEYIGLSPFPEKALDFELAVDVELLEGEPTSGYGIYIRDYPTDSGFSQFRFLVSGSWFAVEQSVDDRPLALAQWTQHAAVQPEKANRLKVVANGGELVFFVNGVEVYKHVDEHPHSGAYGLFASGGIKVAFDNVAVTLLDQ